VAGAVYPLALTLHRASGESLARALAELGLDTGADVDALWRASDLVDEFIGDEPVAPIPPRVATRAAEHDLPPGLVAALDLHLRAHAAGDRIDEVIQELARIRAEAGWPPLAAPIGQILASQALVHVLSATRYQEVSDELRALLDGRFGTPPGPIDPTVRRAAGLVSDGNAATQPPVDLEQIRGRAEGLAASEEDLILLALFGEDAENLLRKIRSRGQREDDATAGLEPTRAERIREIVRIVQESGVGEVTIEDAGLRVTVRRSDERPGAPPPADLIPESEAEETIDEPRPAGDELVRVEAPMVGVFYRAPEPGAAPFVESGDAVAPGQTLCILEAMKLMNEIKTEVAGVIRRIHVQNAQPVEYGQLLFELEPVDGRPSAL
jgi:oxaloacetate decarboxylase alpha subunit